MQEGVRFSLFRCLLLFVISHIITMKQSAFLIFQNSKFKKHLQILTIFLAETQHSSKKGFIRSLGQVFGQLWCCWRTIFLFKFGFRKQLSRRRRASATMNIKPVWWRQTFFTSTAGKNCILAENSENSGYLLFFQRKKQWHKKKRPKFLPNTKIW